MAWAAQTSPEYTEAERLQILAFAYGYATHATGDFFAHSLVNEFTEGVFPAVFDIVGGVPDGARELANGLRHLMMEDYFNQATPRFDANGERNLLPERRHLRRRDAGHRLRRADALHLRDAAQAVPRRPVGARQHRPDVHRRHTSPTRCRRASSAFMRTDGGSFLQEQFEAGMLVHTFGFANAANNGEYRIIHVTVDQMVVAPSFAAGRRQPVRLLAARQRDRHRRRGHRHARRARPDPRRLLQPPGGARRGGRGGRHRGRRPAAARAGPDHRGVLQRPRAADRRHPGPGRDADAAAGRGPRPGLPAQLERRDRRRRPQLGRVRPAHLQGPLRRRQPPLLAEPRSPQRGRRRRPEPRRRRGRRGHHRLDHRLARRPERRRRPRGLLHRPPPVGDVRHAQGRRRGRGRARRRHRTCSTRSRSGRCGC